MHPLSFYINTINTLFHLSHIPLSLIDHGANVLYCCLEDEGSPLPAEYMKSEINTLNRYWNPGILPSMKFTESGFFLGMMAITGDYAVLAGPTPKEPLDTFDFFEKNRRYLRKEQIAHLMRVCEQSSLADEFRFAEMLAVTARLLRERYCQPSMILRNNYQILGSTEERRPEIRLNNPDNTTPEMVVSFVSRICSAIRSGNPYAVDEIWQSETPKNLKTGSRQKSDDQLMFIPLVSSMNNAAIDSGADPNACFDIINNFSKQLQSAVINADGYLMAKHCSYDYCKLVNEALGSSKRSPLSSEIEKYVIRHISERITADDIAEAFSLSRRQVFRIFQTDFKMTMTEYVTREKLRRSAILLKSTRYTISEIYGIYGFTSQSYFSKQFVRLYGLTPSEYRKKGQWRQSDKM